MLEDQGLFAQATQGMYCLIFIRALLAGFSIAEWLSS